MRVRVYFDYRHLDWLVERGFRRGVGDDRLRFMGIKIITDGSLGGRTAYLATLHGYKDNHGRQPRG